MKVLLLIASAFLLPFLCLAQKNTFVLIDVSGNPIGQQRITNTMRQDATELAKQLILGKYDAVRFNSNWQLAGNTDPLIENIVKNNGAPLLESGGHLLMMPFGARSTYQSFKINKVSKFPVNFDRYWNPPSQYFDQNTYGEIAKAKAADIAIDANLSSYYLIIISGLGEDTNSGIYTQKEKEYLDNYKSAVIQNSLGIFRYKNSQIDFKIEVSEIDLKKMRGSKKNTTNQNQVINKTNVDRPSLEIIIPKGSRKKPMKTEQNKLLVSWTCLGCDQETEYTVRLVSIDKQNKGKVQKVKGRYNANLMLNGDGRYKVVVSAAGGLSSSQYFDLDTGSGAGGFLIFLLIALLLGGGGFWIYKQFFSGENNTGGIEEEDLDTSIKPGNSTSGNSSTTPSANSDYF